MADEIKQTGLEAAQDSQAAAEENPHTQFDEDLIRTTHPATRLVDIGPEAKPWPIGPFVDLLLVRLEGDEPSDRHMPGRGQDM